MDRGTAFLRRQINNAVAQHDRFVWALEDHEEQAEDLRFRDLCSRHIPYMRELQRMLEEYQSQLAVSTGLGRENGMPRSARTISPMPRARAISFASSETLCWRGKPRTPSRPSARRAR